ncbi:MAG: HAMP domain-containing sensor histidine kinase [Nannocystaceae bacterium]
MTPASPPEPKGHSAAANNAEGETSPPEEGRDAGHNRLDHNRLNVEERSLGLVASIWLVATAFEALWVSIIIDDGTTIPWTGLAMGSSLALLTLLGYVALRMPTDRWPQRPFPTRRPAPIWLALAGLPMLFFVPLLWWRDRNARRGTPDRRDAERTFARLLALPKEIGIAFAVSHAAAGMVGLAQIRVEADLTTTTTVHAALACLLSLGTHTAILSSRTRAILRPEVRVVGRLRTRPFPPGKGLRNRLWGPALLAGAAAIATPLLLARLWVDPYTRDREQHTAATTARSIAGLAASGTREQLGAYLAQHPNSTTILAGRSYGARQAIPTSALGPVDRNGDGRPDAWVHRTPDGATMVRYTPTMPDPAWPLGWAVLGGVLVFAVTSRIVVHDVTHDIARTTGQVRSVACGAIPPPLREDSFSTHELRQLVRSVDRLVGRITDANMEKYVSIEKATEADRLKSQFLANMSHDLRSPLNSILGFSELMLTGIDGELTAAQREMVQMIHQSGRVLLQQIDDILDTAKIDARRMDLQPEPMPPVALVGRAIHNARDRQDHSVDYQTHAEAGLPPALIDPYRTTQALENVLVYASKDGGAGAIDIDVSASRNEPDGAVVIDVYTPIRPATAADLGRLLRGFRRVPGQEGLGLGLPIAAHILELQGGKLYIADRGPGTVFSLHLPALRPGSRRAKPSRKLRIMGR